jgi:tetratricopeptide (TPR) repeat protein
MSAPDFDALWNYGDPAGTAERFAALLAEHGASAGLAWQAQLTSQLARTHGLRADFAGAHALLDQAEALLAQARAAGAAPPALELARVRIELERGRCHNSSGNPAAAVPCFSAALELARRGGLDNLAVDAAHMLAIAEPGEAGLAWNARAVEMAEGSTDPQARRWLGALLGNQGWGLHELGRYAEALVWFERNLAWQQAEGRQRGGEIARWYIGRCLRSLGRTTEALAQQQALATELAEAGREADCYVSEELGECLLELGREREATPHFALAYAALAQDKLFAVQQPDRLARLQALSLAAQ